MERLVVVVAVIALVGFLIWYFFLRRPQQGGVERLPLQLLGLRDIPAVPFSVEATAQAAVKLLGRHEETTQALNGLQRIFTIQGKTANARSFLYGQSENTDHQKAREMIIEEMATARLAHFQDVTELKRRLGEHTVLKKRTETGDLTKLFLSIPDEFSISWTTWAGVFADAEPLLPPYAKTLEVSDEGAAAATATFWPHIARHGMAFNLLLPQKLGPAEAGHPHANKMLYRIDLRLFESFASTSTGGFERFTPGVVIELFQDPLSLSLVPYQIEVRGGRGTPSRTFVHGEATCGMWLYALQAAKTAVTVWGIWLGHVYHWHIVTAALQLTLSTTEELSSDHPVRRLLDPMSKYLIGFDDFLLLAYEQIAPPTSFKTPFEFLELQNFFARGRDFHDDDPIPTLARLNIDAGDFSSDPESDSWDTYPIVRWLLDLWQAADRYVRIYVGHSWADDDAVINDTPLRAWIRASADPEGGNVTGLPALDGPGARDDLIRLLTSYLYRITAHGSSRMNATANPVLSFVANYPPCLQSSEIHRQDHPLTTEELLRFLPNTGTIGSMVTFLFTFVFSAPYESFIPATGIDQDLFFDGGELDTLNAALVEYRKNVERVLRAYDPTSEQIHQWPRNIET